MVMPLVEMGSLREVMEDPNDTTLDRYILRTVSPHPLENFIPVSERINKIVGIARGVAYLHSQTPPIIHGDLHPVSVLDLNNYTDN